jgi:hypothetical protein
MFELVRLVVFLVDTMNWQVSLVIVSGFNLFLLLLIMIILFIFFSSSLRILFLFLLWRNSARL